MIVKIDIKRLDKHESLLVGYWGHIFIPSPMETAVRVSLNTLVRMVQFAHVQYNEALRNVLATHNRQPNTLPIGPTTMSFSCYEACLESTYRALRGRNLILDRQDIPDYVRAALSRDISKKMILSISRIRNEIAHLNDRILKGQFQAGQASAPGATGPEIPYPQPDNPKQTLKTIDRIKVADFELPLATLYDVLFDLGEEVLGVINRQPKSWSSSDGIK
jgi:hypothetical protein